MKIILGFALLIVSCAPSEYFAKDYSADDLKGKRIAIYPVSFDHFEFIGEFVQRPRSLDSVRMLRALVLDTINAEMKFRLPQYLRTAVLDTISFRPFGDSAFALDTIVIQEDDGRPFIAEVPSKKNWESLNPPPDFILIPDSVKISASTRSVHSGDGTTFVFDQTNV
jgi:hypothetical protein